MVLRPPTLLVCALVLGGCGSSKDSALVSEPIDTCTEDVSFDEDPECFCEHHPGRLRCRTDTGATDDGPPMRISTLTMDVLFGYDQAAGEVATLFNPFSGLDQISYFAVNLGGSTWDGDTGLPGPPNNWCFVLWDLHGVPNEPLTPTYDLSLRRIAAIDGLSNCGQDSSPGANDAVRIDGSWFNGADPVVQMTAYDFELHFGGPVPTGLNGVVNQFVGIGYQPDNFWGAEVRSTLPFGGDRVEALGYAWTVDEDGAVARGPDGQKVLYTIDGWLDESGPKSGVYLMYVPWLLRVR